MYCVLLKVEQNPMFEFYIFNEVMSSLTI